MTEFFWHRPIEELKAEFIEEMNEILPLTLRVVEVKNDYPKFRVEGADYLSSIILKGKTLEDIVIYTASKYFRETAIFKGNEFWFFAIV